ncbi:MAG: hypothetical protein R3C03_18635 [Pirellulaceae bacterium]
MVQNVQTIFLTPGGEVFHVATGFLSSEDLLEEAEFALNLFEKLKSEDVNRKAIVQDAHRERLKENGIEPMSASTSPEMAKIQSMQSMISDMQSGSNNRSPFDFMIRQQFMSDNQFPISRPLMSAADLERDPTPLVGNGSSFFASSSSGG